MSLVVVIMAQLPHMEQGHVCYPSNQLPKEREEEVEAQRELVIWVTVS